MFKKQGNKKDGNIANVIISSLSRKSDKVTKIDRSSKESDIKRYDKYLSKITSEGYKNANMLASSDQKVEFCVVVPSYNNENYIAQNLNSLFAQDYHNWKVIYIDDASSDRTLSKAYDIREAGNFPYTKFKITSHVVRMKSSSYSFHEAAHSYCADNDVMIQLDGDDMLAHSKVLSDLAEIYDSGKTWVTFGSYISTSGEMHIDFNGQSLEHYIPNQRSLSWKAGHLRTSYTWLFKKINIEDLLYQDDFIQAAGDQAMMLPMLEMAGPERVTYVSDITCIYRVYENNIHANPTRAEFQKDMEKYVKSLKPYEKLSDNFVFPSNDDNRDIDHIYVINMESAFERREAISKSLDSIDMDYEIFCATNGHKIKIQELRTKKEFLGQDLKSKSQSIKKGEVYKITCNPDDDNPTEFNFKGFLNFEGNTMSSGELGLYCSVKRILEDARDKAYSRFIVFEDDVVLSSSFKKNFDDFNYNLPGDLDLAYLKVFIKSDDSSVVKVNDNVNGFSSQAYGHGTIAIIYSMYSVEKILSIEEYTYPIDRFYWCLSTGHIQNSNQDDAECDDYRGTLNTYTTPNELVEHIRYADPDSIGNMGRGYEG